MSVREFLGRLAYVLMQPYLFFFERPNRAYVVFFDERKAQVLLVKNWLSLRAWSLPGGGVEAGESHLEAALREVGEEVNLELEAVRLKSFCTLEGANRFRAGRRSYFFCDMDRRPVDFNRRELVAARWCGLERLPPTSPQTDFVLRRLTETLGDPGKRN